MKPTRIAERLWRWSVPHPEWSAGAKPGSTGDWEREVGCVLWAGQDDAVFVDPLLPAAVDRFWRWADPLVDGRRAHAVSTIKFHRRSRDEIAARYGASTSRAATSLPGGVVPVRLEGAGEVCFWLPEERALVTGDRILGATGGELRLCPQSWLGYLEHPLDRSEFAALLEPLLELPVERVLVSHGEPVLSDGRAKLAAAIDAAR